VLIDTPGVIDVKRNMLEGHMMSVVKTAMREADAVVAIVDCSRKPEAVLGMVQPPPGFEGPPMCVVLNKLDLITADRLSELKVCFFCLALVSR
jgi:GTPase Era involved in 16S rRNA processing